MGAGPSSPLGGETNRGRLAAVGVSAGRCAGALADRTTPAARLPRIPGPCRPDAFRRVGPNPAGMGLAARVLQRKSVEHRRDEGIHPADALRDLRRTAASTA